MKKTLLNLKTAFVRPDGTPILMWDDLSFFISKQGTKCVELRFNRTDYRRLPRSQRNTWLPTKPNRDFIRMVKQAIGPFGPMSQYQVPTLVEKNDSITQNLNSVLNILKEKALILSGRQDDLKDVDIIVINTGRVFKFARYEFNRSGKLFFARDRSNGLFQLKMFRDTTRRETLGIREAVDWYSYCAATFNFDRATMDRLTNSSFHRIENTINQTYGPLYPFSVIKYCESVSNFIVMVECLINNAIGNGLAGYDFDTPIMKKPQPVPTKA